MKLCMMTYTMARQGAGVEEIVRCAEELRQLVAWQEEAVIQSVAYVRTLNEEFGT